MNQKAPKQAALGFIFITLLIDVIGFGIIIPVTPKLIEQLTGTTVNEASKIGGWLLFAFAIMQFLFAPILGGLSDKYGRRPVLLFSLVGFGLDYLLQAAAPTLTWLFIGRIIAGITGASFTTASAYIADISEPEKRAQNFGMIGAAFGIGFIVGPVIGGVLGQFGPRIPFIAAAVLALVNALYGYFILPESLPTTSRRNFDIKRANPLGSLLQLKKYPVIAGLIVSNALLFIAAHAVQSCWAYFTMYKFSWSETMVGYSLGFVGLCVGLVQGLLIRYTIPKFGQEKSVYIGLAFYTLGFLLFAFATDTWMMFVFLIPYALGGIYGPALQGIMSSFVPNNEQGELQGALTSLMSATSIIGPPLMTNIFAFFTSTDAPFIFPGAAMLLGCLLTLVATILAYRSIHKKGDAKV